MVSTTWRIKNSTCLYSESYEVIDDTNRKVCQNSDSKKQDNSQFLAIISLVENIGELSASIAATNRSFFVFLSGFSIVVFSFFAIILPP